MAEAGLRPPSVMAAEYPLPAPTPHSATQIPSRRRASVTSRAAKQSAGVDRTKSFILVRLTFFKHVHTTHTRTSSSSLRGLSGAGRCHSYERAPGLTVLATAHPGSPGQKSRKTVVCDCATFTYRRKIVGGSRICPFSAVRSCQQTSR